MNTSNTTKIEDSMCCCLVELPHDVKRVLRVQIKELIHHIDDSLTRQSQKMVRPIKHIRAA